MSQLMYNPLYNDTTSVILFLLTDIINEGDKNLTIMFNKTREGFLKIQGQKYKIKNGTVNLDLSLIPDGLIEPRIILGTKSIFAVPFLKDKDQISKIPLGDETYRIIDKAFSEFFVRLMAAESRIRCIEEKIQPLSLLNF